MLWDWRGFISMQHNGIILHSGAFLSLGVPQSKDVVWWHHEAVWDHGSCSPQCCTTTVPDENLCRKVKSKQFYDKAEPLVLRGNMWKQIHVTCCTLLHRPVITNELKELIVRMLDKNPETRITIPEIKVSGKDKSPHLIKEDAYVKLS